jgi:hypothetical protein
MHVPVLRQAGRMLPRRGHPRQAATPARLPQKWIPVLRLDTRKGGRVRCVNFGKAMEVEHDPEKWVPVFRKDHAQTKS